MRLRIAAKGGKCPAAVFLKAVMRGCCHPLVGLLLLWGCTHPRTSEQDATLRRGDCAELLLAADAARAAERPSLAREFAEACPSDKLEALVASSQPADGLLWCGRAKATGIASGCDAANVAQLAGQLHPRLTIGPPDPEGSPDPSLAAALAELGPAYNLGWEAEEPDVIVGRRNLTWSAVPTFAVAAKSDLQVPPEAELKRRAALGWVKALAKALAAAPPEAVDVTDARGCVAYGLSLNLLSGDPMAAANGLGDPAKVAACEKLLGEPAGAGIPVP